MEFFQFHQTWRSEKNTVKQAARAPLSRGPNLHRQEGYRYQSPSHISSATEVLNLPACDLGFIQTWTLWRLTVVETRPFKLQFKTEITEWKDGILVRYMQIFFISILQFLVFSHMTEIILVDPTGLLHPKFGWPYGDLQDSGSDIRTWSYSIELAMLQKVPWNFFFGLIKSITTVNYSYDKSSSRNCLVTIQARVFLLYIAWLNTQCSALSAQA